MATQIFIEENSIYAMLLTEPNFDHGFMYEHAFEDPDGHIWELVHMRSQP
jgi:predicted lactoylglutathione lyase